MKAYSNGNDPDARTRLSYAALLSGITLSNAGLGVVHGFAQPLGSLFPIPHGVVCGGLMGLVNTITVNKVRKSDPQSRFLRKYARIGKKFTEAKGKKDDYYIDLLLDIINQYIEKMNIPRLSTYGVKKKDFEAIIKATGMKNHPVVLTREELYEILKNRL
jgi:alcohol dehydrogenase class IV